MGEPLKIYIHTNIGYRGIRIGPIINCLRVNPKRPISIHFNSPGGDVFEGLAIFNAIKNYEAWTISYIDGIAAGISSIIAFASDEIVMDSEAFIMMSAPYIFRNEDDGAVKTDKKDIRKIIELFAKIYSENSNRTEDQIMKMMEVETFLSADKAYEFGFIDRIEGDNHQT